MKYKDLLDAQHEYCKTEDYPGTEIRPHAFIAGAKWVIKFLSTIPEDEVVDEVVELYEEIKQEEELTKWTIKKMSPFVPNKCESCDRFDECYTRNGRMREFCKMYGANVVFKRKRVIETKKTIHVYSGGKYIGNIMYTHRIPNFTEEELKDEILKNFPNLKEEAFHCSIWLKIE